MAVLDHDVPGADEPSDTEATLEKTATVLDASTSLFLATHHASRAPRVWNAGAFYAVLDPFRLTLVLELGGTTLTNLRADPAAAIVIAPGGPFSPFLQGYAHAHLRDPAGTQETLAALLAAEPQVRLLIEAGPPIAAVELRVQQWQVTDVLAGWLPARKVLPDHEATGNS